MGTRVVRHYPEKGAAVAAAVLLAPIPHQARLAFKAPGALMEFLGDRPSRSALETLVKVYFSPDMAVAEATARLPLPQTESGQAVLEMLMLDPRWEDAAESILGWLRERTAPGSK